jgi:phage terminase large subunit-like protein
MAKISTPKEAALSLADQLRYKARNPGISSYIPHEKQNIFHNSVARRRLYLGGNRAGKTVGGAVEMVWYLTGSHPYRKTPPPPVYGRAVGTDFLHGINQVVMPMVKRWLPANYLINGKWDDSYSKQERLLTLTNGSTLEFMSYDQDLDTFAGTSRHCIWFDEEPPEDIYKECIMRTLDVKGDVFLTLTPVEGMTWIYDSLYLPGISGQDHTIQVIQVETDENPHIDKEEIELLAKSFSAEDLEARRKGRFIQREGLIYKSFTADNNIIAPLETIPLDYLIVAAMDHGLSNPTAWLWAYIDRDGNIVVFDEYYKAGEIVSVHAEAVNTINFGHGIIPAYYVGDPSIRNRDPLQGSSVQNEYAEHGIFIAGGNNNHSAGFSRVRKLVEGVDGKKLFVTANCVNLIREMSRLHWATFQSKRIASNSNRKEDQHKKDDHACDALRYLIMSRPELNDTGSYIPENDVVNLLPSTDRKDTLFFTNSKKNQTYDEHLGEDF